MDATRLSPTSTALTVGVRSLAVSLPAPAPTHRTASRVARPVRTPRRRRAGVAVGSMAAVLVSAVLSPSGTGVTPVAASGASLSAAASHAVTDSWSSSSRRVVVSGT